MPGGYHAGMGRGSKLLAMFFALGALVAPLAPVSGGQLTLNFNGTVTFNEWTALIADEPGSLVGMPYNGSFTVEESGHVNPTFQVVSFQLSFLQSPASPLVQQGPAHVQFDGITFSDGQLGKHSTFLTYHYRVRAATRIQPKMSRFQPTIRGHHCP
jgi:hypothetical protein